MRAPCDTPFPQPTHCRQKMNLPPLPVECCSLEGKASFLCAAARCLRPGGAFVLVDVFLREGEDRAQWLARFRAYMQEAVDAGGPLLAILLLLVAHVSG